MNQYFMNEMLSVAYAEEAATDTTTTTTTGTVDSTDTANQAVNTTSSTISTIVIMVIMVAVFCGLLVSEIPMFSLKVKHWTLAGNELKVALLAVGLISIIALGLGGIAVTIALYTLFSIVKAALPSGRKETGGEHQKG